MKRETLFLKFAVVLMVLPVLALCIFVFPEVTKFFAQLNPNLAFLQYPFLMGLYVTAIVFFFALYQTFNLLGYINKGQAFSQVSVKALKNIEYSAIIFGGLFVLFMPLLYLMAEFDDAPGFILIGLVMIFGCLVVVAFDSILQKLLKNVLDLK